MELKKYFQIVLRWWWLVLTGFIVVTVAGFTFSFSQQPRYRSSLTLVVSPKASISDLSSVRQSLDTLDNSSIINTYAEIAKSRSIYESAMKNLGLTATLDPQKNVDVLVTVIQKTNLIRIDVEGTNPQLVYTMANSVADQSIAYVNNLYELYEIKVLDQAVLPLQPFSPEILRDTGLAAALGLIFGVCISFLAEYIRSPLEILESLSIIDQETGLYNKKYFLQRLREEISRSQRNKRSLAVCLINIDNLDNTEEMYPRQVQQSVRRRVVAHLKRHIRTDEILARWDGKSLAWLLFDASDGSTRQAIERLCGTLELKVFEDEETGGKFSYIANFGAAIYTGDLTESELISLSEQALHKTSLNGTGNIHIITGKTPEANPAHIN
jgi:diguanylate cyclase (GGDEF)-like protein